MTSAMMIMFGRFVMIVNVLDKIESSSVVIAGWSAWVRCLQYVIAAMYDRKRNFDDL